MFVKSGICFNLKKRNVVAKTCCLKDSQSDPLTVRCTTDQATTNQMTIPFDELPCILLYVVRHIWFGVQERPKNQTSFMDGPLGNMH